MRSAVRKRLGCVPRFSPTPKGSNIPPAGRRRVPPVWLILFIPFRLLPIICVSFLSPVSFSVSVSSSYVSSRLSSPSSFFVSVFTRTSRLRPSVVSISVPYPRPPRFASLPLAATPPLLANHLWRLLLYPCPSPSIVFVSFSTLSPSPSPLSRSHLCLLHLHLLLRLCRRFRPPVIITQPV